MCLVPPPFPPYSSGEGILPSLVAPCDAAHPNSTCNYVKHGLVRHICKLSYRPTIKVLHCTFNLTVPHYILCKLVSNQGDQRSETASQQWEVSLQTHHTTSPANNSVSPWKRHKSASSQLAMAYHSSPSPPRQDPPEGCPLIDSVIWSEQDQVTHSLFLHPNEKGIASWTGTELSSVGSWLVGNAADATLWIRNRG